MLAVCVFLVFFLTLGGRLLELPYWNSVAYRLDGEYLLATHDAYHWIAGAEGFEFGAGHPMSELVRILSAATGILPANLGFWLPPLLGSILALAVFFWGWGLGYPWAGVCAGLMTSLSPGFFARTLLGFYDTDLVVLLFAVLLGLPPALWLNPWLACPADLAVSFFRRRGWRGSAPAPCPAFVQEPPLPRWFFGPSRRSGVLRLGREGLRRGILSRPWLLLLLLSGLFGHQTQAWHSFFPYLVRFSCLLLPLLILVLGPKGGRDLLLRAALCHVLPLVGGAAGLAAALAYAWILLHLPEPGAEASSGRLRRAVWSPFLLLGLWAAALVLVCDAEVFAAMLRSFTAYVHRGGDSAGLSAAVEDPLVFPSVAQSIIEVQTIAGADLLAYFYPHERVALLGCLAFTLGILFLPVLLWFAPLLALAGMSLYMGGRMTMFGPPGLTLALCMAGGLVSEQIFFRSLFLLRRSGRQAACLAFRLLLRSPLVLRGGLREEGARAVWCLLSCLVLGWPLLAFVPDYSQGPVISREQAAALRFLRENSPPESVIWNWWDWGYAVHHFARRAAIADGARHGGPSLYLPAAVYTTADPRFARQVIKYTALKENIPARVFEGLTATQAQDLMVRLGNPDLPLLEAPGRQYLVVSFDLLRLGLWITRYGSWNFVQRGGAGALMSNISQALEYNMETGWVRPPQEQPVYARSIDVFSPRGLERASFNRTGGNHFIFNPLPPEWAYPADQERRDPLAWFWKHLRGNLAFTAMANDKIVVDSVYYNTLLARLLLSPPDDPLLSPYFHLVYDAVYTRVYEVR
ncbi:MAG: dolichyl-diphosphooligosaccharide--protein glycosyltransferase subunit STT3 [Desulfovibrio sp.]|nr:dolichyl-diphosphooligosaccharide--protein glycosyltransferase subunit STT3 [Desulfovibrio sp.]